MLRAAGVSCSALSVFAVAGALLATAWRARAPAQPGEKPREVRDQGYLSSRACRSCHPREYASWASSYHRSMTRRATPDTVQGEFDGITLAQSPAYVLGRSASDYYVDIAPEPGAPAQRFPITLVTGSHHMQIYWYETGRAHGLGQLSYAYLAADRRWVPRNAIFLEPPAALRPASDGRWNASCIACHTTLGQPRVDASGAFDTRIAELGIACEACHGPGETHVANNASPLARYRRHLTGAGDENIVHPKKLTHERASYVCGQCHATWLYDGPRSMGEWNWHGPAFRPGGDPPASLWLMQPSRTAVDPRVAEVMAHQPSFVAGQFWSDGVMRVSGREFNGLVDSPCYQRGELACTSCHQMHPSADDPRPLSAWRVYQLAPGMDGDRGCLQCHERYARAPEQHTHHPAGSEGGRCYNCHMTYTSYGLLKALRSHRIDVPNVTATLQAGRPNACNGCHLDKSLGWTARELAELWHVASPPIEGDQAEVPLALLLGLRGDAAQRALVAWSLGWAPARAASRPSFANALLATLMDDPYDAVRYLAERSLRARGIDTRALHYDFAQRPNQRAPVAPAVLQLTASEPSDAERALFARLLPQRDDKPVRLLE